MTRLGFLGSRVSCPWLRPPYWIRHLDFVNSDYRFDVGDPKNPRVKNFKGFFLGFQWRVADCKIYSRRIGSTILISEISSTDLRSATPQILNLLFSSSFRYSPFVSWLMFMESSISLRSSWIVHKKTHRQTICVPLAPASIQCLGLNFAKTLKLTTSFGSDSLKEAYKPLRSINKKRFRFFIRSPSIFTETKSLTLGNHFYRTFLPGS